MIIECIITTLDDAGAVNFAPMGVVWGENEILVRPYRETTTFRNLIANGQAVVNLTDDVLCFALGAIGKPTFSASPAVVVRGVVLDDACSWRELEVRDAETDGPRARFRCAVVHSGVRREFLGFNRARNAVLEAAILATRTRFLPIDEIRAELERLQIAVDKTAGPREKEAMAILTQHVKQEAATLRCDQTGQSGHTPTRNPQMMTAGRSVVVEAPARLHLGLIDLRGDLARWFGGTGAAVRSPSLRLEARPAAELTADGPEAERVLGYARRFLAHHGIRAGACLRLEHTIPAHAGLGSGTQLALATARALAELNGLPSSAAALSAAVGRARRSAIGTWLFEHGGFILEGGRRSTDHAPGPLVFRHALPESWRCVLVIPHGIEGLSGEAEERAFRTLPAPSAELVGEISRLVLMLLLPSIVEADLGGFGRAVTEIQRRVGEVFRAAQGSPFAHPLVARTIDALLDCGAAGAGQSSWGPTTYGFIDGDDAARDLASRLEPHLLGRADIITTKFDNDGARCGR